MLPSSSRSSLSKQRLSQEVTHLCNHLVGGEPYSEGSATKSKDPSHAHSKSSALWELALQHEYFRSQTLKTRADLLIRLFDKDLLPEAFAHLATLEDGIRCPLQTNQIELLTLVSSLWHQKELDSIQAIKVHPEAKEGFSHNGELWTIQLSVVRLFQALTLIKLGKIEPGMCKLLQTFSDIPLDKNWTPTSLLLIYWIGCTTALALYVANDKDFATKIARLTVETGRLSDADTVFGHLITRISEQKLDLEQLEEYSYIPSRSIWEFLSDGIQKSTVMSASLSKNNSAAKNMTFCGERESTEKSLMSNMKFASVGTIANVDDAYNKMELACQQELSGQTATAIGTYKLLAHVLPFLLGDKQSALEFKSVFRLSLLAHTSQRSPGQLISPEEADSLLSRLVSSMPTPTLQVSLLQAWHDTFVLANPAFPRTPQTPATSTNTSAPQTPSKAAATRTNTKHHQKGSWPSQTFLSAAEHTL